MANLAYNLIIFWIVILLGIPFLVLIGYLFLGGGLVLHSLLPRIKSLFKAIIYLLIVLAIIEGVQKDTVNTILVVAFFLVIYLFIKKKPLNKKFNKKH